MAAKNLEVSYNGTLNQWAEVDNDSSLLTNAASITLKDGKNLKTETTLDLTGATKIGNYTFKNLGITEVTIPVTVTSIGRYAFLGCNKLLSVRYGGTKAQWSTLVRNNLVEGVFSIVTCTDGKLEFDSSYNKWKDVK